MTKTKLIVLRMCPANVEGNWMEIENRIPPFFLQNGYDRTEIVGTGVVEWGPNDECAEVYVPAHLHALYMHSLTQ